jgi:hypothetical protein
MKSIEHESIGKKRVRGLYFTLTRCATFIQRRFHRRKNRQQSRDVVPPSESRSSSMKRQSFLSNLLVGDHTFDLFNSIVRRTFGVEFAFVHMIEVGSNSTTRTSVKSHSFFSKLALGLSGTVFVPDCAKDSRFRSSYITSEQLSMRFYAGSPIILNGVNVGILSIMDSTPRGDDFRQKYEMLLKDFAALVSQKLSIDTTSHHDSHCNDGTGLQRSKLMVSLNVV